MTGSTKRLEKNEQEKKETKPQIDFNTGLVISTK
jgi:hypothetical protein